MNAKILLSIIVIFLFIGCGIETEVELTNQSPDTLVVSPEFSIGVLTGDNNYMFGTIADAVTLESGEIAVLDEGARCAKLYTRDGEFIRQISREGSGPGEVQYPGGMVKLSDGSIAILDHATGTHQFSSEGDFLKHMIDFQGQDVPQWAWGVNDLGLVGAITVMESVNDVLMVNFIIGRWDDSPEHSVEYFRNSFPFQPDKMDEFLKNSFFSAAFAAGADGMTCVSEISSENYIIKLFNPDGSQLGTIEREFTPVPKTLHEIQDETVLITTILKEKGVPEEAIQYEPDPNRLMIPPQGLGVDGQGRIWAQSGLTDRVIMDVYSRDGEHLAIVEFLDVSNPDILDFLNIKVQYDRILVYSLQDSSYPRLHVVNMPDIP